MLDPRWRKVFRDLWDNKSRTMLVVLSIAIGVFAFGGLFIAREIILTETLTQYDDTNPANITIGLSPFDDELVHWAARQQYVTGAQGRGRYGAQMVIDDKTYNVTLFAFSDFENITIDQFTPEAGAWPPNKDEILLERTYLDTLGLAIGDTVTVEIIDGKDTELVVAGSVHDLSVIPGHLFSNPAAYIPLRTLYTLGVPAKYNQLEITVEDTTGITDANNNPIGINEIANELQRKLRHFGIPVGSIGVAELNEAHWAADILTSLILILVVIGFASLLLSSFLVINTISGLMTQQKRQIGMMKIIGASRWQIIGVYLVMVTFFGIIALILAMPASMLLAAGLVQMLPVGFLNFNFPQMYLPPQIALLETGVALLSPLAAAMLPILNGTSITAAEAISDHVVSSRDNLLDNVLARVRGFPRPMLMSLRNTFRRKVRLAMTLITLTLAGVFFISILNVRSALFANIEEFEAMSSFDVQLTLDGLYRDSGVEMRAEQISGVVRAESWASAGVRRIRPNGDKGESLLVYGVPYDSAFITPTIENGRWLQSNDQYAIVVDGRLLRDEPDIQVGDEITLELNGDEENFTVVGILPSSMMPKAYVPYEYLSRFRHTLNRTNTLMIRTQPRDGAFQREVADQLESYFDLRDIGVTQVTTGVEDAGNNSSGLDVLMFLLMGMAVLIAAVGGLGLTGTMSLNVLERTREIGVMRAVGAATASVRWVFVIEGIIIGLVSWLIALPLSIPGSTAFSAMLGLALFKRPLTPEFNPQGLIVWLLIVTAISAFSSLTPANRASQISIREALAYE